MARDSYLRKVLGAERAEAIKASKVLMVGAGGIGCELLKNLLLSGFGEIHIVDLDTITLSNLNRQFLFRKKDIDKLKSLTVVEAVRSFNYYDTKLVPHHGNVMDTSLFPLEWWAQFDYIYNALDNLEARRYVNSMSLFLRKPLMESGTTGFEGQIQPIYPYQTECFDCQQKATPKTFPVCTIRSTPSKPIHCIIWAKEFLFNQLFTSSSEKELTASDLSKETTDQKEIDRIILESNELSSLRKHLADPEFSKEVVIKIYKHDVEKALQLESLWKDRQKPTPLDFESEYEDKLKSFETICGSSNPLSDDTAKWNILENLYVLDHSIKRMQKRLQDGEIEISFDKDDEDTLNFVTAAANLRSHVFHIGLESKFDIKQIAGNIIPAIATTNAIISGLSNLESLYFWNKDFDARNSKNTFLSNKENKRATSALVDAPNGNCASCGLASRGICRVPDSLLGTQLENFVGLVKSTYLYSGDISIIVGKSKLVYDYELDDNLAKPISQLGFGPGETILVQDEEDELENLELLLTKADDDVIHLPDIKLREKRVPAAAPAADATEQLVDEPEVIDDEPPAKRRKLDDAIEIL